MQEYQPDLDDYYIAQATGQLPHFAGPTFQRGHGLGGLFGSLVRTVVPFLKGTVAPLVKQGAKVVGREVARSGAGMLTDIASGADPKAAFETRGKQMGQRLVKKGARKLESLAGTKRKRPKSIKGAKRKRHQDIFSNGTYS